MTYKTTTQFVLALLVAGALVLQCTTAASAQGAAPEPLVDLLPETSEPTDGAAARLNLSELSGRTQVTLSLSGLREGVGSKLGARLYVGQCRAGDSAAAGLIYTGVTTSETTQVHLEMIIGEDGTASASVVVPFVIPAGSAQSLLFQDFPLGPDDREGVDIACVPVIVLTDAQRAERVLQSASATPDSDEVLGLALTGTGYTEALAGLGIVLISTGGLLVAHRRRVLGIDRTPR